MATTGNWQTPESTQFIFISLIDLFRPTHTHARTHTHTHVRTHTHRETADLAACQYTRVCVLRDKLFVIY